MPLTSYNQVPRKFAHCFAGSCPFAATCLHHQAATLLPAPPEGDYMPLGVNPALAFADPCPVYLSDDPVRAARGFRKAHLSLPARQYVRLRNLLTRHMSQASFYKLRSGEMLIMPNVQERIIAALRACGATDPIEFDAYEDVFDWGDHML